VRTLSAHMESLEGEWSLHRRRRRPARSAAEPCRTRGGRREDLHTRLSFSYRTAPLPPTRVCRVILVATCADLLPTGDTTTASAWLGRACDELARFPRLNIVCAVSVNARKCDDFGSKHLRAAVLREVRQQIDARTLPHSICARECAHRAWRPSERASGMAGGSNKTWRGDRVLSFSDFDERLAPFVSGPFVGALKSVLETKGEVMHLPQLSPPRTAVDPTWLGGLISSYLLLSPPSWRRSARTLMAPSRSTMTSPR
jgi:hypothetical protein